MGRVYVVITVDTETHMNYARAQAGRGGFFLDGEYKGQALGLAQVLEVLRQVGLRATFFLSVLEWHYFDKSILEGAYRRIKLAGHDLQLHVHPVWAYDHLRPSLWQYSLEEQIRIIREAKELFGELVGHEPLAHRGGEFYGINEDTIRALRANDIPLDSTMFFGYPNCKVCWSKNRVVLEEGVLEVPVTGFWREYRLRLPFLRLTRKREFIKTDVNWASWEELRFFVREAKRCGLRLMNLFLHSYSLAKLQPSSGRYVPDAEREHGFAAFLGELRQDKEVEIITLAECYELYRREPQELIGPDYVPQFIIDYTVRDKLKGRR